MTQKKTQKTSSEVDQFIANARRDMGQRQKGYREQALRMFPWVCARCGREFSGQNVRQLTVHHKDHNHDNNPPDGSNWELLCIYCHDNEHARYTDGRLSDEQRPATGQKPTSTYKAFAGLNDLLKDKKPG
ncbi:MAG: YajD family HNH nuclease [Thermodesulfobacteriota bacterium]|nr:YajD family HNH nuclease [Thermodesulfobacteriota bacterium]